VEQALAQQILKVPSRLSAHFSLAHSIPVLQAAPAAFFEPQVFPSQAVDWGQRVLVGAQVWVLSQALVVSVEPVHEGSPQAVPTAG
jgi:hypothetical protein